MDMDKIVSDIRTFLPKPAPRTGAFDILVLPDQEFRAKACAVGAEFAHAYYQSRPSQVVFRAPVFVDTAVHELTHAAMDADWGIFRPEWLCEGFAEMATYILVRGHLPRRIARPPMAVGAPRALLYGMEFKKHYAELASHIAWLAWNEGMRHLLERFAPGGCSYRT